MASEVQSANSRDTQLGPTTPLPVGHRLCMHLCQAELLGVKAKLTGSRLCWLEAAACAFREAEHRLWQLGTPHVACLLSACQRCCSLSCCCPEGLRCPCLPGLRSSCSRCVSCPCPRRLCGCPMRSRGRGSCLCLSLGLLEQCPCLCHMALCCPCLLALCCLCLLTQCLPGGSLLCPLHCDQGLH